VISESGIFVTNHHVIAGNSGETIAAMTIDGKVYPVTAILAADADEDIAIGQLTGSNFKALPLAEDSSPVGAAVAVLSNPLNNFYMFTQGHVARYLFRQSKQRNYTRVAITADYAKGSSGAPVVDTFGRVIGMVATTRTLHADREKHEQVQMVVRECVPAAAILNLITPAL
jgi:S1-C subfamily serine protease